MTVALARRRPARQAPTFRIDLLRPAFYALAAVLAVLVVLPLAWLAYYSVVDKNGSLTLANFAALVTDATLRRPFLLAIGMALGSARCPAPSPRRSPGWCRAPTCRAARWCARWSPASFVTPPFLGAIAWEILAAPNSGLINVFYRWSPAASPTTRRWSTSTASAAWCSPSPATPSPTSSRWWPTARPRAVRPGGRVLHPRRAAWTTLRKVTLPLVLPAMLAGSLIAILQALTMFGSPAILALPAGFHVITTKIWSLFQYPPKPGWPRPRRCRCC
jgi:iron(III) transport system permease protein